MWPTARDILLVVSIFASHHRSARGVNCWHRQTKYKKKLLWRIVGSANYNNQVILISVKNGHGEIRLDFVLKAVSWAEHIIATKLVPIPTETAKVEVKTTDQRFYFPSECLKPPLDRTIRSDVKISKSPLTAVMTNRLKAVSAKPWTLRSMLSGCSNF